MKHGVLAVGQIRIANCCIAPSCPLLGCIGRQNRTQHTAIASLIFR